MGVRADVEDPALAARLLPRPHHGGSPAWAVSRLSEARILLRDVTPIDDFTIEARILTRDAARADAACTRAMCTMEILETSGASHTFSGLRRRWCFALLLILVIAAGYIIPKFVFFYRVSGNDSVPAEQILRELQDLGVGFGTYGPSIKPQNLKNQMLRRIPELQWLTVTQNGMCAEVVVRERPEREPVLDRKTPQNVVASRAGVITEVLCFDGNCLGLAGTGRRVRTAARLGLHRPGIQNAGLRRTGGNIRKDRPSYGNGTPGNGAAKAPFRDAAAALAPAGEPAHLPLGRRKFRVKLR